MDNSPIDVKHWTPGRFREDPLGLIKAMEEKLSFPEKWVLGVPVKPDISFEDFWDHEMWGT